MRLDDLRFFTRVAALNNLSAAGREFGLSPSAASSRLTTLERAVGAQLFARTTRRTTLTEAGRLFLEHTTTALSEMDMALGHLEAVSEAPSGVLRISCNMFFGRKHVLPHLREFRELYPDIRIAIDCTDRIVDIVAEGYDMAIRGAPLPDSSLVARRLGSNKRALCASPDYIARKGTPKSPSDLINHDCIGLEAMPFWYFHGPDGEIAHRVAHSIYGDSGDFAYDATVHGLGLSVKSISHVWEDLRDGRVVSVMEDYPIARTGDICAVYPPGKYTPPKVSAFIDFLKSKYGKPPYWETDYRGSRASEAGKPPSV
ncbi:LysR family transcriptional regulator [Roseibium polysiphoniae]|uniref:LysR family transcriptional regulator n=1 Tax=Roseibium polysiphoniae TaxID=2571221 RepID=A0ABR9C5R3_9HYPH|nr:LysR family transcriptional regulator [Roseibium polysiphoniae]MBD8875223.1 LysR family transcriptional regulator [Roseibium polysiphoniae]